MLRSMNFKMPIEKRKRSPNWSLPEKNLLLELVEKHIKVIENKNIDSVAITRKLAEWKIISQEYNSKTRHSSRTAEVLRLQWKSMKKNARQEEIHRKRHRIQTDGEPKNKDIIYSKIIYLIEKGLSHRGIAKRSEKMFFAEVLLPEAPALRSKDPKTDIDDIQETEVDSNEEVIKDWSDDDTPKLLNMSDSTTHKINNNEQKRKFIKSWIPKRRPTHFQRSVAEKESLHLNEARELDLQIKREQLKQEKIKTRMLLIDLRLKKKQLLNEK